MMELRVPGVTVRSVEVPPPAPFRLSVAGFVGLAERGPLNNPQVLTNWGQYLDVFGGFVGYSYLPYAVFGFFANGGERCRVVRVAESSASRSWKVVDDAEGSPVFRLEALDPGTWGDRLEVRVLSRATGDPGAEGFRLEVHLPRAGRAGAREVFEDLSLDPAHPRYVVRVLDGAVGDQPPLEDHLRRAELGHSRLLRVVDLRKPEARGPGRLRDTAGMLAMGSDGRLDLGSDALAWLTGSRQGALSELPARLDPRDRGRGGNGLLGLAALEAVDEVGTVAVPDLILPDLHRLLPPGEVPAAGIVFAEPPDVAMDFPILRAGQLELLAHCLRMGERFALLDAPRGAAPGRGSLPVASWAGDLRSRPDASYGALYFPWLRQRAADFGGRDLWLPPCGHLAGVYARSETAHGVGKIPANEVLEGVVDLEVCVSDEQQAVLNPAGVNCLRALPGRGLRVWGGRTLSPRPEWRYVAFRRVALAIVKRILSGLRWTVFEPNGPALWRAVRTDLELLLRGLFQGGSLAGTRPGEAFFVKCDAETNPPEVVDRGELIARVGFAPARPAEFVVVTIRRTGDALQAREQIGVLPLGF